MNKDEVIESLKKKSRTRAEDQSIETKIELIQSVPQNPETPPVTELLADPKRKSKRTSDERPTCLDFGITDTERLIRFPDGDFCSACVLYTRDRLLNNSLKRHKFYKCTSPHTSFLYPAKKKKVLEFDDDNSEDGVDYSNSKDESEDATTLANDSSTTPTSGTSGDNTETEDDCSPATNETTPTNGSEVILVSNNKEQSTVTSSSTEASSDVTTLATVRTNLLNRFENKIDDKQQTISRLTLQVQALQECLSSPERALGQAITLAGGPKPFVNNVLFTKTNPQFREQLIGTTTKVIRKELFAPLDVLREMDISSYRANYESLEVFRRVATKGQKHARTVLPSSAEVKRAARMVEDFANARYPFTISQIDDKFGGGEHLQFDAKKIIAAAVRITGLEPVARQKRIIVPVSTDTASITKNVNLMISGIKISDRQAKCPTTGLPQFLSQNSGGESSNLQSYRFCFPIHLIITKETPEVINRYLAPTYGLCKEEDESTVDNATPVSKILGPGFFPMFMPSNADMKMIFTGVGRGGGMKSKTFACYCCAVHKNDIVTPDPDPDSCNWCAQWASDGKLASWSQWKCYHRPILSQKRMEFLEERTKELVEEWCMPFESNEKASKILDDSHIKVDFDSRNPCRDPSANSKKDAECIHFDIAACTDRATKNSYTRKLAHDLELRDLNSGGSPLEMQKRLRTQLNTEFQFLQVQTELREGKVSQDSALFVIMNAIPCSLHMENRMAIKIMERLFKFGLSNAVAGKLPHWDASSEDGRIQNFLNGVQGIMNRNILGKEDRPYTWRLPFDPRTKEVTAISMDNERTRKVIANIGLLADKCLLANDLIKWNEAMKHYRAAMDIVLMQDDLTDENITTYQWSVDQFYQWWIQMNGAAGVTNYMHLIGAGHVAEYLQKWRNLYRFSQQGWENLNYQEKQFWFRRTNRGGGQGDRNRLKAIGRYHQRCFVWAEGISNEEILKFAKEAKDRGDNDDEQD